MKILFISLVLLILGGVSLVTAEPPAGISGAVAYTEIVRFDYTKDGVRNRVQFWLEFKGRSAVGNPGDSGYQPEEGAIWYYLYDVDKKQRVANWLMGFNMMEGPPPSGPYPMTNIVVEGETGRFEAFGMRWTVVDGGEGHTKDRVTVDDGFRPRQMRTYDGDLRIVSVPPLRASKDHTCIECHPDPAKQMAATGGKHSTMGCTDCHVGHPPDVKSPIPPCVECHQPHSAEMPKDACTNCHRAHTSTLVSYAYNVPSPYCAACHKEPADVLSASGSKHKHLACALCHPEKHKAIPNCQHCHGAPHPQVMKEVDGCGRCHGPAHRVQRVLRK
jgi:predicted CXXCH cytochrome family protein